MATQTDQKAEQENAEVGAINPDQLPHIFCWCRPRVMFCGSFYDGPLSGEPLDGKECPECKDVLRSSGCPICGSP